MQNGKQGDNDKVSMGKTNWRSMDGLETSALAGLPPPPEALAGQVGRTSCGTSRRDLGMTQILA